MRLPSTVFETVASAIPPLRLTGGIILDLAQTVNRASKPAMRNIECSVLNAQFAGSHPNVHQTDILRTQVHISSIFEC